MLRSLWINFSSINSECYASEKLRAKSEFLRVPEFVVQTLELSESLSVKSECFQRNLFENVLIVPRSEEKIARSECHNVFTSSNAFGVAGGSEY